MPPIALPPVLTPQLLNYIRKHPSVPPHTWYFISAAVLAILNRPDEITTVYERAIQIDSLPGGQTAEHEERLKISRRIREALIKSSAVGGVPKVCRQLIKFALYKEVGRTRSQYIPSAESQVIA